MHNQTKLLFKFRLNLDIFKERPDPNITKTLIFYCIKKFVFSSANFYVNIVKIIKLEPFRKIPIHQKGIKEEQKQEKNFHRNRFS